MITALTQANVVEPSCPVYRLPSSVLLADIMMDMTYALTQRLTRHDLGDPVSRRLLWQRLSQNLIAVSDRSNELRHVNIGGGRVVFLVPVKTGASSEYQDFFPPGRAVGLVTRPRSPIHSAEFWEGLSESQWHILLLDWLGHELTLWLSEHTSIKGEGLNRLARCLAVNADVKLTP